LCTALNCDADDLEIGDPTTNIDRLKKQIFRQDYRKRVNYHLTWTLGDGLDLGVGVYGLTRKKVYIKKLKLQRDTNEVITSKRSYWVTNLSEDNQEEIESKRLMPGEEQKCIFLGGEQITLTAEEHTNMKQMTNPGCKLLGFKPASVVSVHYHSKSPHFLFADETQIKGSSKLFSGLWQTCLAKEKVAICLLTLRRRTWPRFVALIPQAEIRSPENDLISPNGFRVEYLPFAEDIRNLSFLFEMPIPSITDEQKELMKKITKKLRFNYSPSLFESPTLIVSKRVSLFPN
jgi:ATP-dependent DNA helicase 2 subunit 1